MVGCDYYVLEPVSADEDNYVEQSPKVPFLTNGFIPPFVNKLWMMVNENSQMCYWGGGGTTVVVNQEQNQCLTHYFKSNVITSFIRQFNMYGFSKVNF